MAIKAETNGLIITITDENGSVVGLSYKGHLYHIYSGVASTWDEAKAYCEARGGHLATISDEAENTVLYDFKVSAGYQKAYIGLSDANEEGNWQWVTGEPLTYTNWYSDQPDNGRGGPVENYAELWNGTGNTSNYAYTWNDATFHMEDSPPFICEWESLEDAQNNIKWTFKTVGSTVTATGKLGGETVVTITGLKKGVKASDLTDTADVIAVSKNALSSSSTVRLKGNYRLALADGVTKSETTTAAGWYIDGTNATYKTIGRTAGYYVDFGGLMIKYATAATSKNLTTVKGLKEGVTADDLTLDTKKKTVTVNTNALGTGTATISGGYTFKLASDVAKSTTTKAGWDVFWLDLKYPEKTGTTAIYTSAAISEGYVLSRECLQEKKVI